MEKYIFTEEQIASMLTAEEFAAAAKERGVQITIEQAAACLKSAARELTDDELEEVAAGTSVGLDKDNLPQFYVKIPGKIGEWIYLTVQEYSERERQRWVNVDGEEIG